MSDLQKELFDIATGNLCAWVAEKEGLAIKDAMQKRVPLAQIAGKLDMQDWLAKKIGDQTRNISLKEIRRNLEACAKADEDIKNGNLTDSMSLELLIVECSMPADKATARA